MKFGLPFGPFFEPHWKLIIPKKFPRIFVMGETEEKELIITAARDRFFEHGFSKVAVDEIASDLGMSKKTVYKFFPTKEDILKGIVALMTGFVERKIESIVASDKPFEDKLAEVLAAIGGIVRRISPVMLDDMRRNTPAVWRQLEAFRSEQIFPKIRRLMQQAKEEGVLRPDVNVDLFFLMFLSVARGIVNPQTLSEHSFSADEAFSGIFRILFLGAMSPASEQRYRAVENILAAHSNLR